MIEDDLELAEILISYLEQYNIKITNYDSPELAEIDGIEVCKMIRKDYDTPIIISSARSNLGDKIACFSVGADDFMPKPYDTQELIFRIKSILRRCNFNVSKKEEESKKTIFTLDEEKMEISKEEEKLTLTNAEYHILAYLIKKAGFVVSREELLSNVDSIKYESSYKSIDVLIGRVRNKIEKNSRKPKYILSIRGVGYKLVNE
jgi:two-component system OmpR family response regulator